MKRNVPLTRKVGLTRRQQEVQGVHDWAAKGPSKYRNIPKTVLTDTGKRSFQSTLEADRFIELQVLEKAGKIRNLQTQVPVRLVVPKTADIPGGMVCKLVVDFQYERSGDTVYEDTKGKVTPVAAIKLKLAKALGFDVQLTRRRSVRRFK